MQINSTYTPNISMKDTLRAISLINELIIKHFKEKYEITKIELPAFYRKDSELLLPIDNITRKIKFDFGESYDIATFPLHYANWRRLMLKKLEAESGEAIQTEGFTVWRDEEVSNVNSLVRDELTFSIVLEDEVNKKKVLSSITKEVTILINKIGQIIEEEYQVKKKTPNYWPTIETQLLENEMPRLDAQQKEKEILGEYSGFILNQPGKKTLQGKVHRQKPPQVYDLYYQNTIIINDRVNYLPIHVADISFYANKTTLSDQLNMFTLEEYTDSPFYKSIIDGEHKEAIEIKIHKSQLYMALLGKGHIGEVQANVESLKVRKSALKDKVYFI
ncbi:hypothetical protein [Mycoplasma todarodis]|uniref:Uncharacterized protein n=1 Tax=Mycoplasma todarodis TaxID=1937191 RepID=A0A4R0XSU1_9MOLU|nr:hypothetical protein [Mycoplasma todarodis]TCG11510.1 hypothetical protein C4B25_01435 [Mycoplasma todarodis]